MQNNNYPKYGRRNNINIFFAGLSIIFILLKFLFSGGWITAIGFIISFIAGVIFLQYKYDRSSASAELLDTYLNSLSPANPKESLTLLKTCAVLGILVMILSLFGPWFVLNVDYRHEFDSSWYDDEHGMVSESKYGLSSVTWTDYQYSDWDEYTTTSETLSYDDYSGFQNRQEVGSKAFNLVVLATGLWSISIPVLYFINKRLSDSKPRIEKLTKVKTIQEAIALLSKELERLRHTGINIASFEPKIDQIKESSKSFNLKASVLKPTTIFVYILYGICLISMTIAILACLQFSSTWAEAMHSENGGDEGTGTCTQCIIVDEFSGSHYDNSDSGNGIYYITTSWGSGWAMQIILLLGPMAVLAVLYNSFLFIKLSKKSTDEIVVLEKEINVFSMPEL